MKTITFPAALLFLAVWLTAFAQTDRTITYQGELSESGQPANGTFGIEFSLWDAAVAGNQIGSTIELMDVPVTDGTFMVQLDFGADAFDNSMRWILINVEGVDLSPRQLVTRTPYAIQTRGINVNDVGQVGIGGPISPLFELNVEQATGVGGVRINAESTGLLAHVTGEGTTFGVHSSVLSNDGFAGWFEGKSHFSGNVGIATQFPAAKLDIFSGSSEPPLRLSVAGTSEHMRLSPRDTVPTGATEGDIYTHTNGTIYYRSNTAWTAMNTAADFSELILPVGSSLNAHDGTARYEGEIGTSEIISINLKGNYQRCQMPYDEKIAGIESGDRGRFFLPQGTAERAQGQRQVGILGHVKLKVSSENGAIEPGDPITCSALTPGVGMKATRSGRVAGIARQAFLGMAGEVGLIEVYVNPHTWLTESRSEIMPVEKEFAALKGDMLTLQDANQALIVRLEQMERLVSEMKHDFREVGSSKKGSDSISCKERSNLLATVID